MPGLRREKNRVGEGKKAQSANCFSSLSEREGIVEERVGLPLRNEAILAPLFGVFWWFLPFGS